MKRSEFLRSLAALAGSACAEAVPPPAPPPAPPAGPAAPPPAPVEPPRAYRHWAWLTAGAEMSDSDYERQFSVMKAAGVGDVLFECFNGREAFFASEHLPVKADLLSRVLPLASRSGLDVHAWIWCLPCSVESVVKQTPEWYMLNNKGKSTVEHPVYSPEFRYLCPTQAPVRAFLMRRVEELVKYPIAGVHLDYLQFPQVVLPPGLRDLYGVRQDAGSPKGGRPAKAAPEELEKPEFDYCYCAVCREEFRKQTDIDPMTLNMPSASDAWRKFRYDQVTRIVNTDLVPVIRSHGKLVSASVLPDWEAARQDWGTWQLDAALPLLHHTLYEEDLGWIGFQTQQSVERLGNKAPCYSGLLVSHLTPPDLTGAIRLALESGARGVGLFSAQSMSALHWEAVKAVTDEAEAKARQGTG
ncbi:MAG TPA: hypothetical protein VFU02_19815 [Polyangiaceae bacterium]|nr:hypothetical protein [Polyangiaceae bacterium]